MGIGKAFETESVITGCTNLIWRSIDAVCLAPTLLLEWRSAWAVSLMGLEFWQDANKNSSLKQLVL